MNLLKIKSISVTERLDTTCHTLIFCPYLLKGKIVPKIIRKKLYMTKLYFNFLQTQND